MNDKELTAIHESLLYAIQNCKDSTTARIIVQDFYASLNRRKVIDNQMTEYLVNSALNNASSPHL